MKNNNNNKILLEIEIIKILDTNFKKNVKNEQPNENEMVTNTQIGVKIEPAKIEEKIVEELPKEETRKVEPLKVDKKELSDECAGKLEELKQIRINNALVAVSQKRKNEFKQELEELRVLLMDPTYSRFISLLFDGELKAISNENLIFVYKTKLLADAFNLELLNLEKVFMKVFNKKYFPIAVSDEEWNEIKVSYNQNKKKYVYKEESVDLTQIFIKEEKTINNEVKKNEIDELFDTIVEYE